MTFLFLCFSLKLARLFFHSSCWVLVSRLYQPHEYSGIVCGRLKLFVLLMNLKGFFFASFGCLGILTVQDKFKLNFLFELLEYHGNIELECQPTLGMIFTYEISEDNCSHTLSFKPLENHILYCYLGWYEFYTYSSLNLGVPDLGVPGYLIRLSTLGVPWTVSSGL